jgi:hypothetical protein
MMNRPDTLDTRAEDHGTTGVHAKAVDDAYNNMEAGGEYAVSRANVQEADARSTVYVLTRILIAVPLTALIGALIGLTTFAIAGSNLAVGAALGGAAGAIVGGLVSARLSLDRVEKSSYESSNLPRA